MKRFSPAILGAFMAATLAYGPGPARAAESPGMALARQLNDAFVSVADEVSPSVVIIEVTERPRGRRGLGRPQMGEGSGIIVTADGYILTNDHVVDNAATNGIKVQLQNGQEFSGSVVGTDPKSDIAVVKINPKGAKLTPARLGDSNKLRVGEFVVAIGHPLDLKFSVTVGHVSALHRLLKEGDIGSLVQADDPDYIQTDAVINPGNSGGPLINLDGEVIGINDMIEAYTDRAGGETVNVGIGLAIPVNLAKAVKDILISRGKFVRSRIGIQMTDQQDPSDVLSLGLKPVANHPTGVTVEDILKDSPASKSSLKIGDLIVAVDNTPVSTARDLYHEISFKTPGETIAVKVLRDDKPFTVKITTEAVPDALATADNTAPAASPSEMNWGFTVKDLTRDLANKFGLTVSTGVVVTDVEDGSPATGFNAATSIAVGDIIKKIDNKAVSNAKDFLAALKAIKPGQQFGISLVDKDGTEKWKSLRDPRQPTE